MRDAGGRYERFGWTCEHFNPVSGQDVRWHLQQARDTGGPVLELACGTGRLMIELARAGITVDGIEQSQPMLERATENLGVLPSDARDRIALYRQDMTDFDLARRYALIILADNSLAELPSIDAMRSCFQCVRRHLDHDGRFVATIRGPDANTPGDRPEWTPWSQPIRDPTTGAEISRRVRRRTSGDRQRVQVFQQYRTSRPDGPETVEEFTQEHPVLTVDDYLGLFSEAGFAAWVADDTGNESGGRPAPVVRLACER